MNVLYVNQRGNCNCGFVTNCKNMTRNYGNSLYYGVSIFRVTVRNRRYAVLQQMRRTGDYFSEQEMERRDPLLYDHLIGQHQTQEEREEKYSADTTEPK